MTGFGWASRRAPGSELALVYSEQLQFEGRIQEIWNAYNDSKRRGQFSSFTTASYKDCVPLQAADLLAYEMNCFWQDREYKPQPTSLSWQERMPHHIIREGGGLDISGCYDAGALEVAMTLFRKTGDI